MTKTVNHFLSLESQTGSDLENLVEHAVELKAKRREPASQLAGQCWGMIFTKSSTRTRVSFEVGVRELGGHVMFFSGNDLQLGRGEPIKDTARVMGRMIDGAIIRTFDQSDVDSFAEHSNIPTVNALTDEEHPCQVIADLLTMRERLPDWKNARVCFLGDGDCNMARSWLWAAARLGFELVIGAPSEFQPPTDLIKRLGNDAKVRIEADPKAAVEGCDVLYTDVWVSMGKEEESAGRLEVLRPFQVNEALLDATGKKSIVMHCLPAYREQEITETVLEAQAEVIFDQAENRLHAQKAILCHCVA